MRRIVVAAIIAGIVLAVGLILLGLMGGFLVDWAWFSAVRYPGIFWTVVGAKAPYSLPRSWGPLPSSGSTVCWQSSSPIAECVGNRQPSIGDPSRLITFPSY
jgi:hypothetical protein